MALPNTKTYQFQPSKLQPDQKGILFYKQNVLPIYQSFQVYLLKVLK